MPFGNKLSFGIVGNNTETDPARGPVWAIDHRPIGVNGAVRADYAIIGAHLPDKSAFNGRTVLAQADSGKQATGVK